MFCVRCYIYIYACRRTATSLNINASTTIFRIYFSGAVIILCIVLQGKPSRKIGFQFFFFGISRYLYIRNGGT